MDARQGGAWSSARLEASPPPARVVPVAAPALLSLSHYDTASLTICHVITAPTGLLRLFTFIEKNHIFTLAQRSRLRLDPTNNKPLVTLDRRV